MAQTGYTPILIYSSSTAAAAPVAGNLTNSTLGSELAINITDGKLFYKDNANAIQVIGWKVVPTTAGGTGLTSYAQGDLLYYNSGTTLTALAKSTTATRYLSNTGTNNNPAWAQIDLTNGVTGRLPYANLAQGSALSVLGVAGNATADVASIAAGTDNQVLRRSGTTVGFGAIALNQSAAVTGTLPTGNGGTGLTSFTANGVVYASSTSALATGSTLTFNGSTLATSSANASFLSGSASIAGVITSGAAGTQGVIQFGSSQTTNNIQGGPDYIGMIYNVASGQDHKFAVATSEKVRFFASGGVSIGNTTDPGATNLSVTGNTKTLKINSDEQVSGTINNGVTATLFALPAVGVYLVTARQDGAANGGIRAAAIVAQGTSTNGLTSLVAVGGATLVGGTGFNVDLTNTAGGPATFRWSYTKLSS